VSDFNQNEPMIEMYTYETMQLIDRLEILIMESEQTSNLDFAIDEIFRIMHTIKGNSMMMLYENIAVIAHKLEDLFDLLRKEDDIKYDVEIVTDLTLGMIDFSKNEIEKIRNKKQPDGDSSELKEIISDYLESLKFMNKVNAKDIDSPKESDDQTVDAKYYVSPEAKNEISTDAVKYENHYYLLSIFYEKNSGMENIRAFTFIHLIKDKVNSYNSIPRDVTGDDNAIDFIVESGFIVLIATYLTVDEMHKILKSIGFLEKYALDELDEVLYNQLLVDYQEHKDYPIFEKLKNMHIFIPDDDGTYATTLQKVQSEIKHTHSLKTDNESSQKPSAPIVTKTKEVTVEKSLSPAIMSVDVIKVDKLMDLVGELVVSESMVTRNPEIVSLHLENFEKASRQFRIIMNELQDAVMGMRMVPLTLTFQKMSRIVRDMKKKTGKNVDLVVVGEHTEVDKNVIESIGDPLMHIIRNSVDHGIESVEERIDAGKNETGTITLEARHSGGDVWIIVKDDGKGLDSEKILDKCERQGLLEKDRDDYTDREIYDMLFLPGFSTKDQVTEFSGRGVGLDVVAKNIKKIGGSVTVRSELGIGSEFAIRIPLTLAIIDGMMMKVGQTIFSVPIISIRESFIINEKDLTLDPDGNEMVMVRGQIYPITRLYKMFNIETDIKKFREGIMIMIEENGREKVFFADAILGEQQLVVKSAPNYLKTVNGLTGFALLADGKISIILDPGMLVS